jgi:enoyl-CoA hydratase/carnithine racemase
MRTIPLGRPITAEEALSWGLLCDLVPDVELMHRALGVATELRGHDQEALHFTKEAIGRGMIFWLYSRM